MSFCGNIGFRKKIIDLLYNELFDNTFKNSKTLENWYELIRMNVNVNNSKWRTIPNIVIPPRTNDALLECPQSNFGVSKRITDLLKCNDFGHDTPVWFNKDSINSNNEEDSFDFDNNEKDPLDLNYKRIMFISQDPKRNNRNPNYLYISTPFGFHCKDYRKGKLMTKIVRKLLNNNGDKNICVYLTDFYKFYINPINTGISINSSLINNNRRKFEHVLKKELELFKPDLIVTFGEEVTKNFISFYSNSFNSFDKLSILPVIHTSNQAGAIKARNSYRTKMGYKTDEDMYVDIILKNI